ncbi:MAG: hypothetical protein KGJ06_06095 [Pseudomonadota bacterium]|nr:hypothetical protein [Pseudomonadota bacterium]
MRNSWTQPSLSRDFALLSASVLFILLLISAWVTYKTYVSHTESVAAELEREAERIDSALAMQMADANYMLSALGRQIVIDPDRSLVKLAQVLKSFDSKGHVYSIFSFINAQQEVVVSSNKGVLEKPVDTSDRDYVKKAIADPWRMVIGQPIQGRVSERWVIPVAMGITDYTGKFIGTIMISIDISTFTEEIAHLVKREGITFAILSRDMPGQAPIPLAQTSEYNDFVSRNFPPEAIAAIHTAKNPSGLIARGNMFWDAGNYAYYRQSADYPYIVLLAYDARYSSEPIRSMLWARLLQMLTMALFFVLLLSIIRARMIRPVLEMTSIAAAVARGEPCASLPRGGPAEIEALAQQLRRVTEYIEENKRMGEELRHKMFMFKRAKEQAELQRRNKTEFLAYVCQAMRTPLNTIIGAAQIMKDQLYGPIENRKYRQYVADVYQTGNRLLANTNDLLTQAKAEAGYIELSEKLVDVRQVAGQALAFLANDAEGQKLKITMAMPETLPRLLADEFRLQQAMTNLLAYMAAMISPVHGIVLEGRVVNENKDQAIFAIILRTQEHPLGQQELVNMVESGTNPPASSPRRDDSSMEEMNFNLELARTLVILQGGQLSIHHPAEGAVAIVMLFGTHRIRHIEEEDK